MFSPQLYSYSVSSPLQDGTTPLHIACEEGHDKVVQVLLKHPRIVVNRGDAKSMSPLEHAVRGGYTRIVKLLLSRPYIEVIQVRHTAHYRVFASLDLVISFHCILTGKIHVV